MRIDGMEVIIIVFLSYTLNGSKVTCSASRSDCHYFCINNSFLAMGRMPGGPQERNSAFWPGIE
jgi:hypothetical protein